jgi:hypothetical protein
VRGLEGGHIDALIGFTTAGDGVLSAEQVAFRTKLTTDAMVIGDLSEACDFMDSFPKDHALVKKNLNRLLGTLNANQSGHANAVFIQVEQARVRFEKGALASGTPTTSKAFKEQMYPKATFLQDIVRGVENGVEYSENKRAMFDPSSGKSYVPFESATKVTSGENLVYAFHIYCVVMCSMVKEAPQVYFLIMKEITRVTLTHGFKFAHKYVDALLRKLDEKVFSNPVALMKSGEHNRVLADLEKSSYHFDPNPPSAPPLPPKGPPGLQGGRVRMVFGAVTTPIGGQGGNLFVNKCNRFHASPQLGCTAGIPVGHASGKEGLCAFTH